MKIVFFFRLYQCAMIGALLVEDNWENTDIWEWGIPTSTFNQKKSADFTYNKVQVYWLFQNLVFFNVNTIIFYKSMRRYSANMKIFPYSRFREKRGDHV